MFQVSNKTPAVWKKLVDNIDVSEKGGVRVAYEAEGKVRYVYLTGDQLQALLASRKSLEEANVKLADLEVTFAANRKADQAYKSAYNGVFRHIQDHNIADMAGKKARQAIIDALALEAQDQGE